MFGFRKPTPEQEAEKLKKEREEESENFQCSIGMGLEEMENLSDSKLLMLAIYDIHISASFTNNKISDELMKRIKKV